jgi:hypothetical protein
LETFENWTAALDQGHNVDVVYLDYQKAFDTVPFKRLLVKLKSYGISGKMSDWISGFLTDRRMQVSVRGSSSEWCNVSSGVPQGSVLGPFLFLAYVNDIPDIVESNIKMFADDTKIWLKVISQFDIETLQGDLNRLCEWSRKWLLKFHVGKCKRMHLGHSNTHHEYTMADGACEMILIESEKEKDLGIWTTPNLKPSSQCLTAANKATSVLRSVNRSFQTLNKETFNIIYRTFIRPHLEYCVQAWSPYLKKDIQHLENVQRRATRKVKGLKNLPYEERLRQLGLYSLEQRRIRGDLIETYKLLTGKENVKHDQFFKLAEVRSLRGHSLKLFKERSRLEVRKNFFSQRIVNQWNSLPQLVVDANNVNMFKTRLDRYWNEMGIQIGYQA